MTSRERLAAILCGLAGGFFGGLFGVGGGIIMVPILSGPLRLTQHQAHGTSLAVILFSAIAAGAVYAFHGNVAWTTGVIVGLAGILGAPLGAGLASRLTGPGLKRAFCLCMFAVALRLLAWTPPHGGGAPALGVATVAIELAIGLAVGVLAGFMGIGGGLVAVPAFTLLLGMPQQLAQGTSLLVILGSAASGARAHAARGNVVTRIVPWTAAGAVLGSPLASWWVQRLPQILLSRGFAVFLIVTAIHGWTRVSRSER